MFYTNHDTGSIKMSTFFDKTSGLLIGTSDFSPFTSLLPSQTVFQKELDSMILSASGWRKIYTISGEEEDTQSAIGPENAALSVYIAQSFSQYIKEKLHKKSPTIVVGIDTRPTGQEIAEVIIRILLANGIQVQYLFISAAPEIMAYARQFDGFLYISASHNPIGHNGIKFGLHDGGVIPGSEAAKLSALYKELCSQDNSALKAVELFNNSLETDINLIYDKVSFYKEKAVEYYKNFTQGVISSETDDFTIAAFMASLKKSAQKKKLTILADMNGSARTLSIDKDLFTSLGFGFISFNDKPREIMHAIIPEPENLTHCARKMEELHSQGETSVVLGYMPDCDGDRGNIVYWNEKTQKAEVLKAQEVFALSVLSEVAYNAYKNGAQTPEALKKIHMAVSVNDPTSMRIEDIAKAFSANVYRAEVGEANVVNLARSLRDKGFIVPILGEGSNGGTITHPAAVRDPVNTLFALIKLLTIKDDPEKRKLGLYHLWLTLTNRADVYSDNFTMTDVINTLPSFTTTGVSEPRALLHITTKDHAQLKKAYQKVLQEQWEEKKVYLADNYGIVSWRAVSNNGIIQTDTLTDFSQSKNGGLKIIFSDNTGSDIAFIWMRGSGTEPVFRVMCDAKGNTSESRKMEADLLEWHRTMVCSADVA